MKKLLLFLLTILLPTVANAYDAYIDGIYYYFDQYSKTATVTYLNGGVGNENAYSGIVNIPATVNYNSESYSVSSIDGCAFRYCSGLTSVTIPNSVTSIGYQAFYGCSDLTSVTIPNSLTSVDYQTFQGCSSLTSMTIPNSVTTIGGSAFSGCSSLTSITIPNSVKSIGSSAFQGCSNLTSVDITDITAWCKIAFGNGYSNPTSLAHHLYLNNVEITDLVIPNSVTTIGRYSFYQCSSLTSVTIPNGVTNIGDYAFYGCSGLTSVAISDGLTSIGSYAFSQCSGLTSVAIPDGVTSIGSFAFSQCSGLLSIAIPDGVKNIEEYTFRLCSSLTSITIPSSVTSIGAYAFYGCSSLTSVTIPDGVINIEERTFSDCSGLTSVAIPNSVKSIGNNAFSSCSALTSIAIPNSVTSIGESAFYNCYNLETLKLPDQLQIIKKAALKWCSSLKSLTIPAAVEYIYSEAFSGCNALESIKALPENPPFLYDNSFSDYSIPLLVPDGCKEAYQNAQGWKNFTNISDNKYQLTYLVDGEEYKSYIIEYGTPITPEAEPTKETYKFSGWSDIPETMPNHDVTVTGTFTRYFDVGNLTKAVDFVMNGSASAEETALYDLNNNEKLDIGDVILIVKFILNNIYNAPSYIGRRAGEVADLCQYTAAQFEVKTTGNVDLRLVKSMEQTHQLMYQQKDTNTYAVVVYSLSNQLMQPENGKIIETDSNSDMLNIENVTVATPTGEIAYYQTLSATTGIEQIESENGNGTAVIYDLKGNRLNNSKALNKGIYIVNGKKAVVR